MPDVAPVTSARCPLRPFWVIADIAALSSCLRAAGQPPRFLVLARAPTFGGVLCTILLTMDTASQGSASAGATGAHARAIRRVAEALAGRHTEVGRAIAARIVDEI